VVQNIPTKKVGRANIKRAKGKLKKALVCRVTSFLLSLHARAVISLCLSPCGISRAAVQSLKVRNCKIRAKNRHLRRN
jgi:hypothetical protein